MNALPLVDLLGYWLGIFLTLCILSFLYKDNPFYKAAEHLFIGVSIGYVIIQQYYNVLRPKVIDEIGDAEYWFFNLALIPLVLVVMLFVKAVSKRLSWVGRYPLAIVVALYAGLQINGYAQGDLGAQAKVAMQDPVAVKIDINTASKKDMAALGLPPKILDAIVEQREKAPFESLDQLQSLASLSQESRDLISGERGPLIGLDAKATVSSGDIDVFGTFSNLLLFFGLIAGLIYFYFSIEHKGVIGKVSRFGVWIIMIGFGAAFGFTVMGRLALMVGRVQDIRGDKLSAEAADKVNGPVVALISVAIIVTGLVIWELRNRNRGSGGTASRPD